ncbi:MAG: hypothetical protein KGD58_02845 [Candidatus Lokiarchaeota archaeon]|nr:hypothetical protein [Candidatus Lokiarchaeota archaeon]
MSEKKDERKQENLKTMFENVFKKERSESFRSIFREGSKRPDGVIWKVFP